MIKIAQSDSSFETVKAEIEGMKLVKVLSLLFFSLGVLAQAFSGDYQVVAGDSSSLLEKKTSCPLEILKKANPDYDFSKIQKGDRIVVPESYTIKKGDTFYSLSRTWGASVSEIQSWNGMAATESLKTGVVVFKPVAAKKAIKENLFWPLDSTPQKEPGVLRAVTFEGQGKEFRSVCEGTVVYKGEFRGIGPLILIENKEKLIFAFGNFQTGVVEFGQNVKKGQVLGTSGTRSTQRLYFFVFRQGEALDPYEARR